MLKSRVGLLLVCIASHLSVATAIAEDGKTTSDQFRQPFRVECANKVLDTGVLGGHSAPAIVDLDGDGLKDLVVGSFAGTFQFFRNQGTVNLPVYSEGKMLRTTTTDIKVYIYCCIGAQPRFADLNGDKILDLITNSYDPGHCHLFLGNRDGGFERDIEIKDRDGIPVRAEPSQREDFASFGSFFETVDWDNDNDLDLLIGCFDGSLKLRINEGNSRKFQFANDNQTIQAGNDARRVKGHCCPVVADWDADGSWDIVTGSEDGSVAWFRNLGSKGKPEFAEGELLIKPSVDNGGFRFAFDPSDVRPGIRSQVEVADFNGDGRLDLLTGDYYTSFDVRSDLTITEKANVRKLIDDFRARREEFLTVISVIEQGLQKQYPGKEINSQAAKAEFSKAYNAHMDSPAGIKFIAEEKAFYKHLRPFVAVDASEELTEQNAQSSHGHIWVYLRK